MFGDLKIPHIFVRSKKGVMMKYTFRNNRLCKATLISCSDFITPILPMCMR